MAHGYMSSYAEAKESLIFLFFSIGWSIRIINIYYKEILYRPQITAYSWAGGRTNVFFPYEKLLDNHFPYDAASISWFLPVRA